jgi:DNA-binding NarL/FixJ family response regulator
MNNKRTVPKETLPSPGILLLDDASLCPVAFNREALQILAFPVRSEGSKHCQTEVLRQIKAKLVAGLPKGARSYVTTLRSGNRTYLCRALNLSFDGGEEEFGKGASTLLLIERPGVPAHIRESRVCRKFGLSPRECQVVALLVKGMTTKEVAKELNLSANTVKSFLRMIMAKMGVSTRAGVVGKLHENIQP